MAVRGQDIASVIRRQIEEFGQKLTMVDVGVVVEVGDGIARIHGLAGVGSIELLEFEGGTVGMALNLEEDGVGAVILGDPRSVREGTEVRSTGRVAELPVGEGFLGRVVDALGKPIDGKGPIETGKRRPAEIMAPGVADRQSVNTPVQTGVKAIDAMIPIGRGQRELIIGDRSLGKTTPGHGYDYQSEGRRPALHLRGDRAKGGQGRTDSGSSRAAWRDGTHHRRGRDGRRPRSNAVPCALRRLRHGRGIHAAGQGRPNRV